MPMDFVGNIPKVFGEPKYYRFYMLEANLLLVAKLTFF